MDGFLEPGISLALRMDQYPGLPSANEDPNMPGLTDHSRTPGLVEGPGFLLNGDLRLPRLVEMEEFSKRFVRNNDMTQQQSLHASDSDNSKATAETMFTYDTNNDNDDDHNNDGDDNNSDENIGDGEPNNNNRYVHNRNMNVCTASVSQDHEEDEELESEPSDLFCGTICNEKVRQMNRSREHARMNGCCDDSWNPIEPLLTSSTLVAAANVTAASIKSPGSTLAGNMSSLKNTNATPTSSWKVNHLHLLRTVSDIDTSIGEEDFKDCVEAILKQHGEEDVEQEAFKGGNEVASAADVVYLSELSSCSSFGSCFDDIDRPKLANDPETLSFESCFDQSGPLKVSPIYHHFKNVNQKARRTYDHHSSPRQTSTRHPSPASTTNDSEYEMRHDLLKTPESDRNSSQESFEMIKSPEIEKTTESLLYTSCRSDFVSMDQSESSLSKLEEARETFIQNFRATKKQLRSRLSSLARWINSYSEEEHDANLAVELKTEVTPQVNVPSEVKVTPPTVKLLSRVKRQDAVDMGNMDGDFDNNESFVVIHNSACKRSLPFEAEKDRSGQVDCKRQISYESCRAFDRTTSQEGLLSDTESHIQDHLGESVKKGNSTCSIM